MRCTRQRVRAVFLFIVLVTHAPFATGIPWQLGSYELCASERLRGIDAEASGVTYSHETDSLWVITRSPPGVHEYTVLGDRREYYRYEAGGGGQYVKDPEGITWMYFHTFAIAGERGPTIGIVNLWPGEEEVDEVHLIDLSDVVGRDMRNNMGLEGVTYDSGSGCLYAVQEKRPKMVWKVYPETGRAQAMEASVPSRVDDLAGIYIPRGADYMMLLSEEDSKVVKTDYSGDVSEERTVRGRMPEGLTFTADGALMIIVGEPNEMFVYTSTGECKHDAPVRESSSQSAAFDPYYGPNEGVLPPRGYCNFNKINICDGIRHGTDWCNSSPENCDKCSGRFCWADGSGFWVPPGRDPAIVIPAPTGNTAGETYSDPSRTTPSTASSDDGGSETVDEKPGYCNFNTVNICDGVRHGTDWCNSSAERCDRCGGRFCWSDGRGYWVPPPSSTPTPTTGTTTTVADESTVPTPTTTPSVSITPPLMYYELPRESANPQLLCTFRNEQLNTNEVHLPGKVQLTLRMGFLVDPRLNPDALAAALPAVLADVAFRDTSLARNFAVAEVGQPAIAAVMAQWAPFAGELAAIQTLVIMSGGSRTVVELVEQQLRYASYTTLLPQALSRALEAPRAVKAATFVSDSSVSSKPQTTRVIAWDANDWDVDACELPSSESLSPLGSTGVIIGLCVGAAAAVATAALAVFVVVSHCRAARRNLEFTGALEAGDDEAPAIFKEGCATKHNMSRVVVDLPRGSGGLAAFFMKDARHCRSSEDGSASSSSSSSGRSSSPTPNATNSSS